MNATTLHNEFQYYLDHQAELAQRYQGRYIVIKGGRLLGDYETAEDAVRATAPTNELGTFLVQRCDADPESTKVTFRSRVRFAQPAAHARVHPRSGFRPWRSSTSTPP